MFVKAIELTYSMINKQVYIFDTLYNSNNIRYVMFPVTEA